MNAARRETPNQSIAKMLKVLAGFSFAADTLLHLLSGGFGYGDVHTPYVQDAMLAMHVAAVPLFFMIFFVKPKIGLFALWSIAVLTYAIWVGMLWKTCDTQSCYAVGLLDSLRVIYVLLPLAGAVLVSFASKLENA